jgi:hypothetical protein
MSSPSYLMYLLVFKNPSSEQVEIIRDTFSNFDWSMGFAVEEVVVNDLFQVIYKVEYGKYSSLNKIDISLEKLISN